MAPSVQRREPTTATVAVLTALGVGTLAKQLGLGPVPPGLVQLFGPVAGSAGRHLLDNTRRALFVFVILLAPWWGAAALSAASSVPVIEDHLELPNASYTILAPGLVLLWSVHNVGACPDLAAGRRLSEGRRDQHRRWFALSSTFIKRWRGARAARQETRGCVYNSA